MIGPRDLDRLNATIQAAAASPSARRRAERGDKVIQAGTSTNRKARRSQRVIPTLDWNCGVCKAVICRVVQPRAHEKARAEQAVARAFRQHNRLTQCVPLEEIVPIVIPDEALRR